MVRLVELTPEDWRVWRELRLAALAESPEAFCSRLADWQGDGDREERWRGRLGLPGSHNVVAILDDARAGMASGVAAGEGEVELISMWVTPPARGRGVGDALMRHLESWAHAVGAQTMRLGVAEDNEAAGRLYLRHGFGYTGEQSGVMADGARRELVMVKRLQPHA